MIYRFCPTCQRSFPFTGRESFPDGWTITVTTMTTTTATGTGYLFVKRCPEHEIQLGEEEEEERTAIPSVFHDAFPDEEELQP